MKLIANDTTSSVQQFEHSELFYLLVCNMDGTVIHANRLALKKLFNLPELSLCCNIQVQPIFTPATTAAFFHAGRICKEGGLQQVATVLNKKTDNSRIKWELRSITNHDELFEAIGVESMDAETIPNQVIELQTSLQVLADTTTDINIILDNNYRLISFNKRAADFTLEFSKKEMHPGDDFRQFLLEPNDRSFYEQFNEALTGKRTIREISIKGQKDEIWWYRGEMNPLMNRKGDVIGVSINSTDVTYIQKTKQVLQEISWIQSHEIRKPLANIKGLYDLLKLELPTDINAEIQEIIDYLHISITELDEQIRKIVNKTYDV